MARLLSSRKSLLCVLSLSPLLGREVVGWCLIHDSVSEGPCIDAPRFVSGWLVGPLRREKPVFAVLPPSHAVLPALALWE